MPLPDNFSQAAFSARYEPRLLPLNAHEQVNELASQIKRINEIRRELAALTTINAAAYGVDDGLNDMVDDLAAQQRDLLQGGW